MGARRFMVPPDVRYQPFYCEENVFHLCQHPALGARLRSVVFVSGAEGGCLMWRQRAGRGPASSLFWDYHVFLLVEAPWQVWDLDTTLGFPVPAVEYFERSFREGLPRDLAPVFRVVPAAALVATLVSDRSHMRARDGSFTRPPPPWPALGAPERGSNLPRFIDMTDAIVGEVRSLPEMLAAIRADEPGAVAEHGS